jgi:hypothetical protein
VVAGMPMMHVVPCLPSSPALLAGTCFGSYILGQKDWCVLLEI